MEKNNFNIGDEVEIICGQIDKVGAKGKIHIMMYNGAIVKLNNNWFTPVQFKHLKKINIKNK